MPAMSRPKAIAIRCAPMFFTICWMVGIAEGRQIGSVIQWTSFIGLILAIHCYSITDMRPEPDLVLTATKGEVGGANELIRKHWLRLAFLTVLIPLYWAAYLVIKFYFKDSGPAELKIQLVVILVAWAMGGWSRRLYGRPELHWIVRDSLLETYIAYGGQRLDRVARVALIRIASTHEEDGNVVLTDEQGKETQIPGIAFPHQGAKDQLYALVQSYRSGQGANLVLAKMKSEK
ncbi:hypothetical protein BH11ARM1_BH11ARM1_00640 [soil metagenome]